MMNDNGWNWGNTSLNLKCLFRDQTNLVHYVYAHIDLRNLITAHRQLITNAQNLRISHDDFAGSCTSAVIVSFLKIFVYCLTVRKYHVELLVIRNFYDA